VYGSSLILYKKIQNKTVPKMLYEPVSLTFLSTIPFFDQFSAILKYLYLTFFHLGNFDQTDSSTLRNLKKPPVGLVKTIEFLCSHVAAPSPNMDIKILLKPPAQTSNFSLFERVTKNNDQKRGTTSDSSQRRIKSVSETTRSSLTSSSQRRIKTRTDSLNHPLVDPSQEGVEITESRSSVVTPESSRPSHLYKLLPKHFNVARSSKTRDGHRSIFNFLKGRNGSKLRRVKSGVATDLREMAQRERRHSKIEVIYAEDVPFTLSNAHNITNENLELSVTLSKNYSFFALPTLSVNLYQNLFNVLDVHVVLKVLSCIMCEVSIIFYSSQFSLLTKIQECFKALLFPFTWSHIYIPNLPGELLHIVDAPVPYMIGINSRYLERVKETGVKNKVLFVDIDSSSIEYHRGVPVFPQKKKRKLVEKLLRLFKPEIFESDSIFKHTHDKYSDKLQWEIRTTFLRFWKSLLGDYRGYLRFADGKAPVFRTAVYAERMHGNCPFFIFFLKTHMFNSFIQKHVSHPGLLADFVEYICTKNSAPSSSSPPPCSNDIDHKFDHRCSKKTVTFCIPDDLGGNNKNFVNTEKFYEKDALSEKSWLEECKAKDLNRISLFLENIFMNDFSCSNGELASISELLKLLKWREFFLNEVITWIKNPTAKCSELYGEKERKKIKWIKNLDKIGLKKLNFNLAKF